MKVVVLTTSYPRSPEDPAGRFVADAVERLRARDVEIDVVGPERFRHFGIAGGAGVVPTLRRRPWLSLALPALGASFAWAARRAASDAGLVHAHWLPAGAVALATRRPFVVTLHGTDVELARRARPLARAVLRRARVTIAVSSALADEARRLDARQVRVIPNGVELPSAPGEEEEPPFVLFAGRLSREKGVLDLVEAAREMRLVVVGDGPLRPRVPGALGFVSRAELERLYARAAVVACPSHREGFGVVAAEAAAWGKPVVAGDVGGLRDVVFDGETGLLVPPRDAGALRAALERLLADADLRRRLGAAARERARERFSWDAVIDATLAAYSQALSRTTT